MGEAVSLSLSLSVGRLQVVSLSQSSLHAQIFPLLLPPFMPVLQESGWLEILVLMWHSLKKWDSQMVKSKQTREVCPSRTPTGHCEETWCRAAAGHSLARIGSPLVPALVLDRLWCRGRRPLGTATCVASLPICPTLPGRRHRVVTCFIICATHPPPPTHCLAC